MELGLPRLPDITARVTAQSWPAVLRGPMCNRSGFGVTTARAHTLEMGFSHIRMARCDLCSATFSSSSSLYRHKDKVHRKKRRFACHLCGKGFNVKELYEDHLNMHYNIKAHKCPHCNSLFTYKSNMYHHIRGKHSTPAASWC